MTLRFRVTRAGSHVRIAAFLAPGHPTNPGTFANCGALTYRNEEWETVSAALLAQPLIGVLGRVFVEVVESEGES